MAVCPQPHPHERDVPVGGGGRCPPGKARREQRRGMVHAGGGAGGLHGAVDGAAGLPEAGRPCGGVHENLREAPSGDSWVYVRQYCAEIDEAARNRMELIVRSLAEQSGVTEQLKAENQMEWVRQMNACKAQAEEIVKAELIYD